MKRGILLAIVGAVSWVTVMGYVPPASADTRARELQRMEVDGDPDIPTVTIAGPAQDQAPEGEDLRRPRVRVVREYRAMGWRLQLWNLAKRMTWIRRSLT